MRKLLPIIGILCFFVFSQSAEAVVFAKYDGIDGESTDSDHQKWIEIGSVEWGVRRPENKKGLQKRRANPIIEDLVLTMAYDKAAPKLQKSSLLGQFIPLLQIEQTATFGEGGRATFIRYELRNVMITGFNVSTSNDVTDDGGPPRIVVSNNFEEIKVTYTEYDNDGDSKGNTEFTYTVEGGR